MSALQLLVFATSDNLDILEHLLLFNAPEN